MSLISRTVLLFLALWSFPAAFAETNHIAKFIASLPSNKLALELNEEGRFNDIDREEAMGRLIGLRLQDIEEIRKLETAIVAAGPAERQTAINLAVTLDNIQRSTLALLIGKIREYERPLSRDEIDKARANATSTEIDLENAKFRSKRKIKTYATLKEFSEIALVVLGMASVLQYNVNAQHSHVFGAHVEFLGASLILHLFFRHMINKYSAPIEDIRSALHGYKLVELLATQEFKEQSLKRAAFWKGLASTIAHDPNEADSVERGLDWLRLVSLELANNLSETGFVTVRSCETALVGGKEPQ